MDKDTFLKEFIKKFCIPKIGGVEIDPEYYWKETPHLLTEKQMMVNWLKENLSKLTN